MKKLNSNLGNKNTISDIMGVCRCTTMCNCDAGQKPSAMVLHDYSGLSNVSSTTGGPGPY
ncbi:hypothetical protein [Clostridium sp. UBA1056]|uniref:hypothetical protein n=1 Tax=unclassified Clostridium TaxID=2614128 RepID=UPI003216FE59